MCALNGFLKSIQLTHAHTCTYKHVHSQHMQTLAPVYSLSQCNCYPRTNTDSTKYGYIIERTKRIGPCI